MKVNKKRLKKLITKYLKLEFANRDTCTKCVSVKKCDLDEELTCKQNILRYLKKEK